MQLGSEVDDAGLSAHGSDQRAVGSYGCTFTFRPATGDGPVTVTESVTRAMSRDLEAGAVVRIRYLPEDPSRARIVRHQMYL